MSALLDRVAQHIYIAFCATLIALIIGITAGIWIKRQEKMRSIVLNLANIFQTIPSLALLAFFVPLLGIGFKPTITTLTVYALLPIIRNTYTALENIPADCIEATRALGFTPWQRLRLVEMPLAIPVMLSGIRVAVAMTIGITTIAAFIGAGGLGDFITSGLSLGDNKLILLGAIPTALLALGVDFVINDIETRLTSYTPDKKRPGKLKLAISIIIVALIVLISFRHVFQLYSQPDQKNSITIASKNFTEQYILANIMSELIEEKSKLHVIKKFNLGTTQLIHEAMLKGEVDLYAEYTGTGYLVVLKQQKLLNAKQTLEFVRQVYKKEFNILWLQPFGFSNSQTLAVKTSFAKENNVRTLSELAKLSGDLIVAAPAEFLSRPDSYPLLKKVYDFNFKKILQMQPNLMYQAIGNGDVQCIEVFTTDGRIKEYNLVPMIDNKHAYPPYDAVPVIRAAFLQSHPELKAILNRLAGKINQNTIIHLNYLVDVKKQSPEVVAHKFLKQNHMI